ncbi:glycoside hydrolase family 113 [Pediococcus acidilactici]|uniref:glycoside hydrolase family 113 n=1 Tax=Pediococcus acidilactici TaxID=1254 RepID=UPI003CEFFE5D
MNYTDKITRIIVDMYKPNGTKNNVDVYDMSDSFNARVGDEQIPLMIEYRERGIIERMTSESLTPFAMGYVGQPDEHGKVTAETGVAVSYHGSSDDIIGAGKVKMDLPGAMFPQEGMFYGFFGLENSAGKRITSNDVCFEVKNGNPDMYVDSMPFRSELQKLLDEAVAKSKTTFGDISNAWEALKKEIEDALTKGNTDIDTYLSRLKLAEERLEQYEKDLAAGKGVKQEDLDDLKKIIEVDVTNRVGKLEKIVGRNYLTYKTISSTLYSIGDGISDDNINAILRVGGTLAMPIMVTVTNSTDPNIVMQSDDRVQQNIDHIKKMGLAITMIKPHIGLAGGYDGLNRATYTPSDFGTFFKNWKDVMLHYAETCNENGIPILCIGCEQEKCTDPKYISKWIDIYQSIKAKYPDILITYAMEGNEAKDIDGHGQIAQAVDLVGINVYPNYINKDYDDSVTQDELIAGWYFEQDGNHYMDMFDNYVEKYGKPIFVTETGSMPWKDGLARLLSLQEGDQDFSGQAAAYQATFEAFSQNPNIVGISIWNTNAPFNFTSPNKTTESELVLKKYFKGGLI